MTTQINLLPWREEIRQLKKNFFLFLIICFVTGTLFIIFIMHFYIYSQVIFQQHSTDFLQREINQAQGENVLLKKMKKEQDEIISHIQFIFSLHIKNYKAVKILDELARITPENVFLTSVNRKEDNITIQGNAGSNLLVTQFMRNVAKSHIFEQPVLTEMSAKENDLNYVKLFQLKVKQKE